MVLRTFVRPTDLVVRHRDEQRRSLLSRALWRIDRGERTLLARQSCRLIHRLGRMATAVGVSRFNNPRY